MRAPDLSLLPGLFLINLLIANDFLELWSSSHFRPLRHANLIKVLGIEFDWKVARHPNI